MHYRVRRQGVHEIRLIDQAEPGIIEPVMDFREDFAGVPAAPPIERDQDVVGPGIDHVHFKVGNVVLGDVPGGSAGLGQYDAGIVPADGVVGNGESAGMVHDSEMVSDDLAVGDRTPVAVDGDFMALEFGMGNARSLGSVQSVMVVPEDRAGDQFVRRGESGPIAFENATVVLRDPSRVGAGNAGVAGETAGLTVRGPPTQQHSTPRAWPAWEIPREAEGSLASQIVRDGDSVPGRRGPLFLRYEKDAVGECPFGLDFPPDDQGGVGLGLHHHPGLHGQHIPGLEDCGPLQGIGAFGFGQLEVVEVGAALRTVPESVVTESEWVRVAVPRVSAQ